MLDRPLSELLRGRKAPLTLAPGTTAREACLRMRECAADAVLVADGSGPLLGIFTGRDAVRRVLAEGRDADRTKLAEVMSRDPAAVLSYCLRVIASLCGAAPPARAMGSRLAGPVRERCHGADRRSSAS